jgi:transcriptional regulator with XRE-family HTH domain
MNRLHLGIRPARRLLKVSQGELARLMGKNPAYISAVETGRHNGSILLYNKICETLGLPLVVVAMEALQVEEIRSKEMEEFLSIKNELYRFLGVDKIIDEKNETIEMRKIAEKLCPTKPLVNNLQQQNFEQKSYKTV